MISRHWTVQSIAALVALLSCGLALATPPPVSWSLSMPRLALNGLRLALQSDPDDVELHGRIGIASAKLGNYPDAVAAFGFALGSEVYERQGIAWHADALSALGRHDEAIALRREALCGPQAQLAELLTRVGLVDDLRAKRDPRAEDEAWDLIAAFPDGPTSWATLADVLLDRAALDEAATALALPTPPRVSARVWRVRARLARLQGDPEGAEALLREGLAQNQTAEGIAEDLAQLRLDAGDPAGALDLLEAPRFGVTERPARLAMAARAYVALGEPTVACEYARRLPAGVPGFAAALSACGAAAAGVP